MPGRRVPADLRERAAQERLGEAQQPAEPDVGGVVDRRSGRRRARSGCRRRRRRPSRRRRARPGRGARSRGCGTPSARRGPPIRTSSANRRPGPSGTVVQPPRRGRTRVPVVGVGEVGDVVEGVVDRQRRSRCARGCWSSWLQCGCRSCGVPGARSAGSGAGSATPARRTTTSHRRRRSAARQPRLWHAVERPGAAIEEQPPGLPGRLPGRRPARRGVGALGRRPQERAHDAG